MNELKLNNIEYLIKINKFKEAELEISKLGSEFYKNTEYLYLRAKIFLNNKLYYLALDTLLIATEFDQKDKIYELMSKIYNILGNKELSKNLSNAEIREKTVNALKKELTGISQEGYKV